MSPALQKLRKDLDNAKAHQSKKAGGDGASGPQGSVGFDVIELLFTAIAAQDAEIRRLKAEKAADNQPATDPSHDSTTGTGVAHVDTYVGHTEIPENSPVYSVKNAKPQQG